MEMDVGTGIPKATCPCGACAMERRAAQLFNRMPAHAQERTSIDAVADVLRVLSNEAERDAIAGFIRFQTLLAARFDEALCTAILRTLAESFKG